MIHPYKTILYFLLLFCGSMAGLRAQAPSRNYTLQGDESGTSKAYVARDYISLKPGFRYAASGGNNFSARVDPSLLFPPTEATYLKPDGTTTSDPSKGVVVGGIPGQFAVSPTGAATYTIPIACPPGVNGMQPSVSIAYNSQGGNGLAGWGTNLSGFSVITRGPKDIYHDGAAAGITHDADEAYYLDGQRLILHWGTAGMEGAIYYPESDPFTKVAVHGTNNSVVNNTWFEVCSPNGMKSYFGSTAGARQSYTYNGLPRINSWYVDYVEDPSGNYMDYTYYVSQNFIHPHQISYGKNRNGENDLLNTVTFDYEDRRNDPYSFALEGNRKVSVEYRLSGITCATGSSVFRSYELGYDLWSDGATTRISRLTSVTEKNGAGEALNPLKLGWKFLPSFSQSVSQPAVNMAESGSAIRFTKNQEFYSADLNGDAIPDIIGIVPVDILGSESTYVYIYWGSLNSTGNVQYISYDQLKLNISEWASMDIQLHRDGSSTIDANGDGINELVIPSISINDVFKQAVFYLRSIALETAIGCNLQSSSDEMPIYSTGDFNNDGKGEVVLVEKGSGNGRYPCHMIGYDPDAESRQYRVSFNVGLSSKPEKIFTSDFNADGLADLLVFYDGGYSIFWNQGGELSSFTFSDNNSTTGTNIANVWMIRQGDFNGDGLPDLLMNATGDSSWYFALNNGDGTFSKTLACTLEIYDQSFTTNDDDKFTCLVSDLDDDGKSDVVISKAMYKNLYRQGIKFDKTYTYWMRSTGSKLVQASAASSNRKDDGYAYRYLLDDFNGDGQPELMNYGHNCYNAVDADTVPSWRMYRNENFTTCSGKVTYITDGLDTKTFISYGSLAKGDIYTKGSGSAYPVADCVPPIHAVAFVVANNEVPGKTVTTNYAYAGLKVHLRGRGLLGMTSQTATNTTLGTVTESGVKAWDPLFFLPSQTYTKTTVDGATAETTVGMTVLDKGSRKYFAYPSTKTEKDFDGNTVTTTYGVNATYGYPESETADFGGGMYKSVQYGDYVLAGGAYRPRLITRTQKHPDDTGPFIQKTAVAYDTDRGWKTRVVENYQSSLPVTTTYAHDTLGNVLSSVSSGTGIVPVTNHVEYDPTRRFPVKKYTSPASAVNTFTYDTWGNLLSETDSTNTAFPLTATHTYDNWGERTGSVSPEGLNTTYVKGWGTSPDNRYFLWRHTDGRPWTKTSYDNQGREVLVESTGEKGMAMKQSTVYNDKGQATRKQSQTGNLTVTETFAYDGRGRLSSQRSSMGQSSTFGHGNRSDTTVTNGRTYVKTFDAWGNVKSSTDPVSNVSYQYASTGKPRAVTSGGATFSMNYDDVGNQLSLSDPNAGTTTYAHDAAGRVTHQVDARGKATDNVYDGFGRLDTCTVDGIPTAYTYGSSGNGAFRLVRQQTGESYVEYVHDNYGRVVSENRQVAGEPPLGFGYQYNPLGQLAGTSYPGGLSVGYTYDAYGNKESTSAGSQPIWQLAGSTGTVTTSRLGGTLTATETHDSQGLLTNLKMEKGAQVLHSMDFLFDGATGNLSSRSGMLPQQETFAYDNLDRLTDVSLGGTNTMHLGYSANGNIDSKTGIGAYSYGSQPHAVTGVENTGGLVSNSILSTPFNAFNKVDYIADAGSGYRLDFTYGPDRERWKTVLEQNGNAVKTTIFADDYEQVTAGGATQRLYYLDGGVIYVKQDGQPDKVYYACTDHLGSIVKLVDGAGTEVFAATYDAWGKQTITNSTFAYYRGYTGHEHLPEFDLINMNGRLYDPATGRFLSCDPYVQMPDFSQNFNRYSYCLNNPLKYNDPSGGLFGIDDAILMYAVFSAAIQAGAQASMNGKSFWSGAWKGAAIGAASVLVPAGVGQVFGHGVGSLGNELLRAGAHGLGNGLLNVAEGGKFGAGFATGVAASFAGSGAQALHFNSWGIMGSTTLAGALGAELSGGDWMAGAMQGMNIGAYNFDGNKDEIWGNGLVQDPDGVLSHELNVLNVYANPWVRISPSTSEIATFLNRQTGERRMSPRVMGLQNFNIEFDVLTLGGGIAKSLAGRVAAKTGTNLVYEGLDAAGTVRYVGITEREAAVRFSEHLNSGTARSLLDYRVVEGATNLTRTEARIWEQTLINQYGLGKNGGLLLNKINSIAPKNWSMFGIQP